MKVKMCQNVRKVTLEIVTTSIRSPEQIFRYRSPSNAGTSKYLKTCSIKQQLNVILLPHM